VQNAISLFEYGWDMVEAGKSDGVIRIAEVSFALPMVWMWIEKYSASHLG
jgi:hypothetical protein